MMQTERSLRIGKDLPAAGGKRKLEGKGGFGVKKHKIAFFAASWDGELLDAIIGGIKKRLDEIGWELHVFISFPAISIDDPDNFGNYNTFSLVNYSDYDGYLMSVNVVNGYEMVKTYHPGLLSGEKPMVALDQCIENFSSLLPDGYSVMFQMVEHLIVKHGCRNFIYVGGAKDHSDNIVRKKAFLDALEKHNIPIEPSHIRDYWFLDSNGRQAYRDFKELGLHPDAVVCANDAMALGYCQEAELDGLHPPVDFLITGYDNDDNAKSFYPMISSVEKKAEKLGYEGCCMLLDEIAGGKGGRESKYVPELVLRGSCGCYSGDEREQMDVYQVHQKMYMLKKELTGFYDKINNIRQNLALATTEDLFKYHLADVLCPLDIGGYAMCINQDVYYSTAPPEINWNGGFCNTQCVVAGARGKKRQDDKTMLMDTSELYPEFLSFDDDKSHVYCFYAIQSGGIGYGYFVMADASNQLRKRFMLHMTGAINGAYANLRNLLNLEKLNKWLDNAYTVDAMTGLYNRFGYMRDGFEMFEKAKLEGTAVIVMFMDMDRLKYINDTFGHSAGDEALIEYSAILKKCAGEDKMAVRYGGDEFLIIGPVKDQTDADAFVEYVLAETQKANEQRNKPYNVEGSIGYILSDPAAGKALDDYVKEADKIMYEVKKKRKMERVN